MFFYYAFFFTQIWVFFDHFTGLFLLHANVKKRVKLTITQFKKIDYGLFI